MTAPEESGSQGPTPVTYRRLVDGGLVYDDRQGCIHHLNETAARIWDAWRAGESREAIVRRLCADYEVAQDTAGAEVDAVLRRFEEGEHPRATGFGGSR